MTLETIDNHLTEVQNTLIHVDRQAVFAIVERLELARKHGKTVVTMGNGGSAATASHFANDLIKMCGIRTRALPDMTSIIMAYGNDNGWENMFWGPFEALSKDGDVLFAISCSGQSQNIVQALNLTQGILSRRGRILLTGDKKTKISEQTKYTVFVPHEDIRIQEDIHMIVCHAIVGALKEN